jgi:hypothetical protein
MGYVPSKDATFFVWVRSLLTYVQPRLSAFNIQDAAFQPLLGLNTAWEAAYTKSLEPNRGSLDVADKNRTRAALDKALRSFIKAFLLYSPYVSNDDRNEMQIPIQDTKSRAVQPPATIPEYDVDSSIPNRLFVNFWDQMSKEKKKPKSVHGVEVRWELREDAPAKVEDLSNSSFTTRTPYTFVFTSDKQGQRVYFCLRWENSKGDKGPWGALTSAVIP